MEILNRKASFNYFIQEEIECGIVLTGTEIKAIREGKANIKDSYAIIRNNECYLLNMHISKYDEGNIFNHEENRTRKLLLHKKEILRLKTSLEQEGLTLIPIRLYFKDNKLKVSLGICKGKKLYDKRETMKEKDQRREASKLMKNNYRA
jgi:SsrA-binding protein